MRGMVLTALCGAILLAGCGSNTDATVDVKLNSYSVIAEKNAVSAGKVKFSATNDHRSEVHELAVLRVKPDGSFENMGEIEDIDPGKGGSVTLELTPGQYLLACLIVPGEAGSTVDHLEMGMRQGFQVN